MGTSIIILTVLIRLILWPINGKGLKNQKILTKIQPDIEDLKKKFKDNKEAQAKALMELYSKNKINPLAGFLPILIQIPIIFALWRVFLNSVKSYTGLLYRFVEPPIQIQSVFLGMFDLTGKSVLLAVIAGVLQYFQTKMILPSANKAGNGNTPNFNRIMSQQMLYLGPVLSVVIFWNLPAALPLYWIVVTLMTLLQQYFSKKHDHDGEIRKN